MTSINIGAKINIEKMVDSRVLVQGNSGSGKSIVVRDILEEIHDKAMFIVLDLEGEYFTLREKFDVLLIGGKSGDVPISLKAADLLPRKIMELKVSTVIDLSDLQMNERITYVKKFLNSLMALPKEFWQPCIVVVEEAHKFAGQQEKQESTWAVIDLMTRGRKRGYCGILVTQRISKLHKDAAAECNNKLVGRTFMDIDMKRASEELGFASKQDMLSLRDLKPGEFFAFGVAVEPHFVHKVHIREPMTTHPKVGMDIKSKPIPATPQIKAMLTKLSTLPQEAEKERMERQDLLKKISELQFQLRSRPVQEKGSEELRKKYEKQLESMTFKTQKEGEAKLEKARKEFDYWMKNVKTGIAKITRAAEELDGIRARGVLESPEPEKVDMRSTAMAQMPHFFRPKIVDVPQPPASATRLRRSPQPEIDVSSSGEPNYKPLGGGALRMLKAAAMFHPNEITKRRMAILSRLSHKSGTFSNYMGLLKSNNLIEVRGNGILITPSGLSMAGEVDSLPTDPKALIEMWCRVVGGGAARMLRVLAEAYPDGLTKQDLAEKSDLTHSSGTFSNYIGILNSNGLIEKNGSEVRLAKEIMEG